MSIKEFVSQYENSNSLIRYFHKVKLCKYTNKIFGSMQILDNTTPKEDTQFANPDKFLQFDIYPSKNGPYENQVSDLERIRTRADTTAKLSCDLGKPSNESNTDE